MKKNSSEKNREPFTNQQLESTRPSELLKFKLSEDEISRLRKINERREIERQELRIHLLAMQKPLLDELKDVGFLIQDVWDFANTSSSYAGALPVLLKHLQKPYDDKIKEGIARALAVPEAKSSWHILLLEFEKTDQFLAPGTKMGLAAAIAVIADDSVVKDLISVIRDKSHGESRILFLKVFRRSRLPVAKIILDELANDPEVKTEIQSWKSRKK